eukprot:1634197-Prymnesium_polylepis.2
MRGGEVGVCGGWGKVVGIERPVLGVARDARGSGGARWYCNTKQFLTIVLEWTRAPSDAVRYSVRYHPIGRLVARARALIQFVP